MGRGRAKAKQTKVARELKYHSPETDLEALQRELSGNGKKTAKADDDDPYAAYLDDLDEEDEAADGARSSRR
ncbi:MAG TPA: DUF3073 domain-containing protein [Natronosporangium sp.]